jgi:hypothetical protein
MSENTMNNASISIEPSRPVQNPYMINKIVEDSEIIQIGENNDSGTLKKEEDLVFKQYFFCYLKFLH